MLDENAKLLRTADALPAKQLTGLVAARLPESVPQRERRNAPMVRLRQMFPTVLSLSVGIFIWEVVGQLAHFRFLPPFSNVLRAAWDMILDGQILVYLAASVSSLVVGYSLAVTVGVLLGTLMGRYKTVEYLLDPYVNAFLAAPKLVLVPVLYALFGVSRIIQVIFVFISAFFDVVVNTMRGIQTVDPAYVEMARAFGAKEPQLFWKVLLPGSLPLMMAGLRLAMGRAIKGMVKGEMVIALFGLGALLRTYGSRFDAEKVFAVLLFVIGVSLIFSAGVHWVERRVTRWADVD